MKTLLAAYTLWRREIVRFYRQPSRVVGALGTPLIFWLLIGSGIGTSFKSGAASSNYLHYFFPGTIMLILLFTAIFSTISLIEDRKEGFLQGVLVCPASRASFVLGKILGGTFLALIQAVLFLVVAPFLGIRLSAGGWLEVLWILTLNAFALTGLGFLIAWKLKSIQGFHAIMNLFLMPMWFLSGALFPGTGSPAWIRAVMSLNPLTYGMAALRRSLESPTEVIPGTPSMTICILITLIFAVVIFAMDSRLAGQRTSQSVSSA